jgi:cation diffusion facilitator family transporter
MADKAETNHESAGAIRSATALPSRTGALLNRTGEKVAPGKSGAAILSVASNALLIGLKIVAGVITGSIAIITEAVHSSIDLIASIVALVSVRQADEPPDEDHPYGHEKVENLSAAIEGMLIVVAAGVIIFEATRRLVVGSHVELPGIGIAVVAFSALANAALSQHLYRRARKTDSAALEGDAAHLRTDSITSLGVLAGLGLVVLTGASVFDPIAALLVAAAIVVSGIRILTRSSRVLVDEAPPVEELERIDAAIEGARPEEMVGYHKLRARQAGARRHIDLHVQFRSGITLEHAHHLAHQLRDAIEHEIPGADVLIHAEPEQSADPVDRNGAKAEDESGKRDSGRRKRRSKSESKSGSS